MAPPAAGKEEEEGVEEKAQRRSGWRERRIAFGCRGADVFDVTVTAWRGVGQLLVPVARTPFAMVDKERFCFKLSAYNTLAGVDVRFRPRPSRSRISAVRL